MTRGAQLRWIAAGALLLGGAGCGGGGEGAGGGDATVDVDTAATAPDVLETEADGEADGGGTVTRAGDELLPELAGMPLPDDASLRMGYASNGIISQQVDTDLDVAAAEAFYRERLAEAGFTVTNEPQANADVPLRIVEFTAPDGATGNITIQAGDAKATHVSISMVRQG